MYSSTYTHTIVLVLISIASIFRLEVSETNLTDTINTLITIYMAAQTIYSGGKILYERYKKGGVSALGWFTRQ